MYVPFDFSYGFKFLNASLCLFFDSGTMLTRIFHPNVSKSGEICVNTLKKDWRKEYGIAHILITVSSFVPLFCYSVSEKCFRLRSSVCLSTPMPSRPSMRQQGSCS